MRKPELRQHESGEEERHGKRASPAPDQRHEGNQPDEELRREDLSKCDRYGNDCGAVAKQVVHVGVAARKRDVGRRERQQPGDRRCDRGRVRAGAGDVLRAEGRDDVQRRPGDMVRGDQDRGAETLQL